MSYKRPDITEKMKEEARSLILSVLNNATKVKIKTDIDKARSHIDKFYRAVLKKDGPEKITLVQSPKAAIAAVMELTGVTQKEAAKQIVFLNLWVYWPTRAWAALHIRGIDPTKERIRKEVVRFTEEKFEMSKDVHAILCCSETCFVVEFPVVFQAEFDLKKFKLHRDGGLAIEYSDGTGFGYLNHVEVPDWVACTPPDELNTAKVMAIQNVDVRREGLARIPNDKKIKDLNAKTISREKAGDEPWLDFELLDVDFKDSKTRQVFKALDPSSGKYIFERIEENDERCKTAIGAAAWRDGEKTYIVPSKRT